MSQNTKTPILHLICGLPGWGKTTLAKSIVASTGAIRFSPDEWIKEIWNDKAEAEGNPYRDQIEQFNHLRPMPIGIWRSEGQYISCAASLYATLPFQLHPYLSFGLNQCIFIQIIG